MTHLKNSEGTRYEWRANEVDKGVYAPEWRTISRIGEPSEWRRYGALKSNREDAEYSAFEYARYLSRKM